MFTVKKFFDAKLLLLALLVGFGCSSPVTPPAGSSFKDFAVTVVTPASPNLDLAVQAVDPVTGDVREGMNAGRNDSFRISGLTPSKYNIIATGSIDGEVYYTGTVPANLANTTSVKITLKASRVLPPTFTTSWLQPLAPGDTVKVATATEGATIRYTLGGGSPDETSPVYNPATGITVTNTMNFMVKVKAWLPGLDPSKVVAQGYNVQSNLSAAPTFSLSDGTYNKQVSLVIYGSGDIYYTTGTNPVDPVVGGTKYTAPLTITNSAIVKAIAVQPGKAASQVAVLNLNIDKNTVVLATTPVFSLAAGTYTSTITPSISSETGATIWYTTDNSDPSPTNTAAKSVANNTQLTISKTSTVKAVAQVTGKTLSAVATAAYVIDSTLRAATPTSSIPTGTYITAQSVALSSEPGASIYYSINETADPTTASTAYTGPISINVAGTYIIKAIAVISGKATSFVGSVTITYSPNTPVKTQTPSLSPSTGTYNTAQTVVPSGEAGSTFYYTLDGSDPTEASSTMGSGVTISLPNGQTSVTKTVTVRAKASGKLLSDPVAVTITINSGLIKTTAPTIVLPGAGPFTGPVSVTINSTETADIYYTQDGTAPSTGSTKYAGAFQISAVGSYTIRALAVASGKTPSDEATPATFTINPSVEYKLYFKPASGTTAIPEAYVWYGTPAKEVFGTWASTTKMTASTDFPGWYVADLLAAGVPSGTTVGVIFKTGSTKLSGSADLSRAGTTGFCNMATGTPVWTDNCPDVITPVIGASVAQPNFTTSTTVTLQATSIPSGQIPQYKWDNGALTTFTNGQVLTVGADWTVGQSKTLTVVLTGGTIAAKTYTLTKVDVPIFTGIRVFVKGYTHIYYWGQVGSTLPALTWTTPAALVSDPSGWMKFEFPNATAVNLIFRNADGTSKTPDLSRTAQGDFWYANNAWANTNPEQPVAPAYTLSPAGGNFQNSVSVQITLVPNANMPAVSGVTYSVNGGAYVSNGTSLNLPALGASLTEGQSFTLSTKVTNSVGTTTVGPITYTKSSTPVVVNDPKNLRIYQVMVEAYQDGDSNYNMNSGYGPSNHKGDIRGIINALPYIKSLGMNAIWLTPIFESNGTSQMDATGYFLQDYFKIDDNFGSLADAKELVSKAHQAGIYILFDGVFGHNKGNVPNSPNGNSYTGNKVEFLKEVATYWIDTVGLDGWRLDKADEIPVSTWNQIRTAVETKAAARKAAGEQWGTLGYMVGEIWSGESQITNLGYGSDGSGLRSMFDFPVRYRAVQTLAIEESGVGYKGANTLGEAYSVRSVYPNGALPNAFLTNHDLVRFGNLIYRSNLGYGPENADYWKRHKLALTYMTSLSGPMTIYYGDEYGDFLPGYKNNKDLGFYDDHVSRSNGKVSGFNGNESDLIAYTTALMTQRDSHPALWNGTRINLISSGNIYADLKTSGNDKVVFVINTSTSDTTATISAGTVGGSLLRDLINTSSTVSASGGNYSIAMPALTAKLLQVE